MVRRAPSAALGLVAALLLALVVALAQAAPAAAQAALASDDFNRCSLPGSAPWTLVDPVGDGAAEITGAGTADARLSLTVPEGPSHDPDVVNRSLRLLQAAPDGDFTAELKFESTPTRKYQIQGLTVQQDVGTYLRFEFYSDGSQLHAYAAAIDGGGLSTKASAAITSGSPLYLRVTRAGDAWTMAYSRDGSDYAEVVTFTQPLAVSAVGPYVGNFAGGTAPAHTAVVDYFSHQAGPPAGEDAGTPPGTADLVVTAGSGGSVERTPPAPHACGGTVSLTAVPAAGFRFESWSGALSGTANPETITLSGSTPASVGASFVAEGAGPVIADVAAAPGANAATVTWTTDVPADSRVEYGTTAAYGSGPVTSATPTTAHEVVLSGLTPSTLYHYRVTSADGAGVASSSADRTFTTAAAPGGGGSRAGGDSIPCTAPGTPPGARHRAVDPDRPGR